ncbi:MAG: hypothetical protein EZS28_020191 [Streblomastix strix]|uniref:Uncharacterized protein n=1 Tax=Streblomastix strix TaxID=222440 RepID=A0A5J4VNX9_9EUKA|nr:MAG: hypothetical protein EZS28_020191 [Streblomastix strix]
MFFTGFKSGLIVAQDNSYISTLLKVTFVALATCAKALFYQNMKSVPYDAWNASSASWQLVSRGKRKAFSER